ncbi:adenosylcobinamide-phosphate synthase CbiB [Salinisphaera sp. LB1]|uniref:adenosylcobinamide-phosphate synthase CbiB n=1 Tax=Salinisphaera sp. LB1 TaxID=2183911 RepID=UPI000D7D5304|nr:adenosylcobinamide-phosphate synthase CbiB [Salinisphaera sp. LB1]AWN15453.1 Adenosylcobinamide-phosphate synthase [Salinisphaera sp. LB1]
MALSLMLVAALVADAVLGEPRRRHPLALFGRLADRVEARFNHGRRRNGMVALMVGPPTLFVGACVAWVPSGLAWLLAGLVLVLAVGRAGLIEHAEAVARPLATGDLEGARQRVAWLVSRDTAQLDAAGVRGALLESVLENSSDAIFASVFWCVFGAAVAGPAGAAAAVLAHRLVNTLDAMWGYRTPRFIAFGWAAARLDDGMNWPAARLTALAFALVGDTRAAWTCWREQAGRWSSPNAGPVMAAGAGALGIRLGGGAWYHGAWRERPALGGGRTPEDVDVVRALGLADRALAVIVVAVLLMDGLWA